MVRASSFHKSLVVEDSDPEAEGWQTDGTALGQPKDVLEKKIVSVKGSAALAPDPSALPSSQGGNDEIPIEILSLIDR